MHYQPTVRDRILTLDVLRGFAVLGILIANIPSFSSFDWFESGSVQDLSTVDQWAHALALVFVQGKFRSMLAVLFGVGVWLQFQKRSTVEGQWPGGYIKRSLWLGVIGLMHGLFIWHGDILFFYAGMAILTCLLAPLDTRILKAIIYGSLALALLCGGGIVGLMFSMPMGGSDPGWFGNTDSVVRAFQQGSYLDQFAIRAVMYAVMTALFGMLGVAMLPLFVLGILFGRSGVLTRPSQNRLTRNAALLVGFGIGLPLSLLGFQSLKGSNAGYEMLAEFFSGPLLSIGYLMLLAMVVEKRWLKTVTGALAKVGQIALTSYLTQSLICTFVFYSWGLGLFGRYGAAQNLGVVPLVWLVNLVFAHLWLKRCAMGPVEWVWRSLTEGARLPIRKGSYEPTAISVPV